jgi:pilus assembly protein CpaB
MNNKAVTLSLLMAVIAIFFVQSYVESIEDEAKKKFGTQELVVTAKNDIKEQATITEKDLELTLVPKKFRQPGSIALESSDDKEKSKTMKDLDGTVAIVPIRKGEQITYNKLTQPSVRTGLSPQIAPGRRAISVAITEMSGVGKLLKPGDRVDVITVMSTGPNKQDKISKTLLQDVIVLAVGKNVTNNVARLVEMDGGREKVKSLSEDTNFQSVTLEVEPGQAQALALITGNAENALILSLRNNDDTDRVVLDGVTPEDIMGSDAGRMRRLPAGQR